MSWQPIDTAPKDGTPILGWDGRDLAVVYWYAFEHPGGAWFLSTVDLSGADGLSQPTHWQPLPEPPEAS